MAAPIVHMVQGELFAGATPLCRWQAPFTAKPSGLRFSLSNSPENVTCRACLKALAARGGR